MPHKVTPGYPAEFLSGAVLMVSDASHSTSAVVTISTLSGCQSVTHRVSGIPGLQGVR
jgi:hypothetical protein